MRLKNDSNARVASNSFCIEGMSEPYMPDCANGVYVGPTSIYRIPFILDLDRHINRNIAVLGMSGSGKSHFLKSFIIRSNLQRGSGVLVIDWNNEYAETIRFMGGRIIRLGLDMRINIFELYDLANASNIRRISESISHSLNLDKDESYCVYSKILSMRSGNQKRPISLSRMIKECEKGRSALMRRVATKLGQLGNNPMFGDRTEFAVDKILEGVVSMDFSALRDDSQRGEISRLIFRVITELMHRSGMAGNNSDNEQIIVLDEAWRLIKNSEDVGALFREGRKYGFSVVVATQLANDINSEIISNVSCLFLFRLQNDSDYRMLVDSGVIDCSDKERLMRLPVGSCMVSMALKGRSNRANRFFIESVEGIATCFYDIIGGGMRNRISQKAFLGSTRALLTSGENRERIINFLSENNNEVDDTALVKLMVGLGIERSEVVYYLRALGLKDVDIIRAYDHAVSALMK